MQTLYKDFGNIYEYEFWDWWKERGANLFGERRESAVADFLSVEDVLGLKDEVKDGDRVLLSIPTTMTKSEIKKQVGNLIKHLEVRPEIRSPAKYPLNKTKVDVASLSKCLTAYDMKAKGRTNVEIAAVFYEVSQHNMNIISVDRRTVHEYYHDVEMQKKYLKKTKKNSEAEAAAIKSALRVLKFYEKDNIDPDDIDEYVEKKLGILTRKDTLGRKLKNYLNVSANRMIKKAEANIRAVEEGMFPVGHFK